MKGKKKLNAFEIITKLNKPNYMKQTTQLY